MFTALKRIIRFAFQGFWRNKGLSFQVIFIMAVAVLVLSCLFIFRTLSDFLIAKAEDKVDVSVYFKENVAEEKIIHIKEELHKFTAEIDKIDYVSKAQAKETFIQAHQNDELYLEALKEIGDNPFLASLNIKARSPVFYAQISNFLSQGPFQGVVEKVSYYGTEEVIRKLFALTASIKKMGVFVSIALVVLVFLIVFNTIKLTIFAFREEIAAMRLVGASGWFIRGPFILQGLLYGVLSILIVDILLFAVFYFSNSEIQQWFFQFNILSYFQSDFLVLLFWQLIFGFFLGGASSFFAVRKYLRI